MEEVKLYGSIINESTLNGEIESKGSIDGNIGRGVTKVTVNDHDLLKNRDLPNQHPIDAIEGLREELMSIKNSQGDTNLSIKSLSKKIDNKIRTVSTLPSDMETGQYVFLEKGEL